MVGNPEISLTRNEAYFWSLFLVCISANLQTMKNMQIHVPNMYEDNGYFSFSKHHSVELHANYYQLHNYDFLWLEGCEALVESSMAKNESVFKNNCSTLDVN